MIEIIALIFLTRKIGALATLKGQAPRRWKLHTVLAWIGFEIFGVTVGLLISHNTNLALLLGIGCAFGGYLLMKYQLEKVPDAPANRPYGNTPPL